MPDKQIIITVKRKKPSSGQRRTKAAPKKGVLRPRRRAEELARRRRGGTLNFYDLGQILSGGDWIDLPFSSSPAINFILNAPPGNSVANFTNFDSLRDLIFDVPQVEWRDTYRKLGLEDAERYGLDVYLGDPDTFDDTKYYPIARNGSRTRVIDGEEITGSSWSASGLSFQPSSNFAIFNFGSKAFYSFGQTGQGFYATLINDPGADPVTLTLEGNCHVFLMPVIQIEWSVTFGAATKFAIGAHSPILRERFLENSIYEAANGGIPYFANGANPNALHGSALGLEILDIVKTGTGARAWNQGNPPPETGIGSYNWTTVGSSFTQTAQGMEGLIGIGEPNAGFSPLPVGGFLGAILKGSTWYYLWSSAVHNGPSDSFSLTET